MDENHEHDQRAELLKLWREYGKAYKVFVPEEQLDQHVWDRELPEPDDKGTLDPQRLKHWRCFKKARDFLRQRYADYEILAGPALTFDCLVPKFEKSLDITADKRRQYKLPKQGDPSEWYDKVSRMIITSQCSVGDPFRSVGLYGRIVAWIREYTYIYGKAIPRSGRAFLKASALIASVSHRPQLSGLKPHFCLRLDQLTE
jgi:hypothetical protein